MFPTLDDATDETLPTYRIVTSLYDTSSGAPRSESATTRALPDAGLLPAGAITLPNEIGLERYFGAAPPPGDGEHRYFFTVSALDVDSLDLEPDSSPAVLGFTVREHIIARARLVGVAETPE